MSGKPEKKAAPLPFTQQEVNALTRGGKPASMLRRRLRDDRPVKRGQGKPSTAKASPVPISRREMVAISRRGVPPGVRKRILDSPTPRAGAKAHPSSRKAAPAETPAQQRARSK